MKSGAISSFRERVKNSETFKSWSPVVQKISMTRNNLKVINDGLTIAENVGIKKFEKEFNYHARNVELIKELM